MRKNVNKLKGKHKEDKKDSPSVNALITEVTPDLLSCSHVDMNTALNDIIVFYMG